MRYLKGKNVLLLNFYRMNMYKKTKEAENC